MLPIPWASFADNPEDAVVDQGAEVEVDQAGQLSQGVLDQVEVVLLHLGRHKWSCSASTFKSRAQPQRCEGGHCSQQEWNVRRGRTSSGAPGTCTCGCVDYGIGS